MLGEGTVYSQFTILGHHEFKQTILSKSQRIKDLKQMEVTLKETAKLNTEKLRKKMIQDGVKNLEKRRAEIETYNDHRMAMSFAVAGLKIQGVKIKNPKCVEKSFPNFFSHWPPCNLQ